MVDGTSRLAKVLLLTGYGFYTHDKQVGYSPEKVIQSAKEGSLAALSACTMLLDDLALDLQALPSSTFPEVLDMFTTHIENGCPPEKAEISKFQLADVSFMGLVTMMSSRRFLGLKDPPLGPILRAWPSILTWARASIIEDLRTADRCDMVPGRKWIEVSTLLDGICNLHWDDDLRAAAKDPRLLELAVYTFLHSDPHDTRTKVNCIDFFILYAYGRIRHALDDLTFAVEGKPEILLSSILELINNANRSRTLSLDVLHACSRLLVDISVEREHVMIATLEGIGSSFSQKALKFLIDLPAAGQTRGQFTEVFEIVMAILIRMFSPGWIAQALQCRVFEMLATCDVLHKGPMIEQFISSCLPCHLMNPSVIYACEGAVSALSVEQHKQLTNALGRAWRSFVKRFFEVYIFYCYFEVAGYRKGCYRCGRTPDGGKMADLKRCVACKKVEYCSKDCQTTDWKGHKKDCETLKTRKYGPLPPWASPLFRRRLAAYDARRHLPGFRKLAAQKRPGFPVQCLCVAIKYVEYPPQLDVLDLVQNLFDNQESDSSPDDRCFDDLHLHNDSRGVLCTTVFENGKRITHHYDFHWSPPYFASEHGSCCREKNKRTGFAMSYVDENKRELETTWGLVDELAYRGKLSPEMILEGRVGEIRRKVLEVVVREKARMQLIKT